MELPPGLAAVVVTDQPIVAAVGHDDPWHGRRSVRLEELADRAVIALRRERGIEHLLTQPRSPTTTGKIERFHRSLRTEFLSTAAPFPDLKAAQRALDAWVIEYNTARPHQSLKMATPAERFIATAPSAAPQTVLAADRGGQDWVSRTVTVNGVVCVSWQQVSIGRHWAGNRCDVHVDGELLRFWIDDQLVKTAARTSTGEVRNKKACRTRGPA